MNIAAYCRVSTDKSDQLNSLEAQKRFFDEYTLKNGHALVRLYADEGISGTKIKNRKEFMRLMNDAGSGIFNMVVVKDISRFARNTVDLLNSTRRLKALNIETLFLTSNMTVLGNSEFVLTIFGALAQEESANTSKRVKFGKKLNAEKGRVPNIVYGYDKTNGDYFNLKINEHEAEVIRRIFDLYISHGNGAAKIAQILNMEGIKTKRSFNWSQSAVLRILSNELYTGKIINGKQEVEDFLTGVRREIDEIDWIVTDRPDLCIIEHSVFQRAKNVINSRHSALSISHERQSNKHIFSTLIKCTDCGYSFRRVEKKYKNTYIRWSCSGRSTNGAESCENKVTVSEHELLTLIREYIIEVLSQKDDILKHVVKEIVKIYKTRNDDTNYEHERRKKIIRLQKLRQKYMDMYTDELISRSELKEKLEKFNIEINSLGDELNMISYSISSGNQLEEVIRQNLNTIEDIVSMETITNTQLKQIIKKIVIGSNGDIDIYLHRFKDNLDEALIIPNNNY